MISKLTTPGHRAREKKHVRGIRGIFGAEPPRYDNKSSRWYLRIIRQLRFVQRAGAK